MHTVQQLVRFLKVLQTAKYSNSRSQPSSTPIRQITVTVFGEEGQELLTTPCTVSISVINTPDPPVITVGNK